MEDINIDSPCAKCKEHVRFVSAEWLTCVTCRRNIHLTCITKLSVPSNYRGDVFYDYTCTDCSLTQSEQFERIKITWFQAIVLVLYQLQTNYHAVARKGYFHWKHHVASFIEKHWDTLFTKHVKRKRTWIGTISGVLSLHRPVFFISGVSELNQSGWWKLSYPKFTPHLYSVLNLALLADKAKNNISPQIEMDVLNRLFTTYKVEKEYLIRDETINEVRVNEEIDEQNEKDIDVGDFETGFHNSLVNNYAQNIVDSRIQQKRPFDSFYEPLEGQHKYFKLETISEEPRDVLLNSTKINAKAKNGFFNTAKWPVPHSEKSLPDKETIRMEILDYPEEQGQFFTNKLVKIERTEMDENSFIFNDIPSKSTENKFVAQIKREPPSEDATSDVTDTLLKPSPQISDNDLWNLEINSGDGKTKSAEASRRLFRKLQLYNLKRKDGNSFSIEQYLGAQIPISLKNKTFVTKMGRYLTENRTNVEDIYRYAVRLVSHVDHNCIFSPFSDRTLKPYIRRDNKMQPQWLSLMAELQSKANRHVSGYRLPARAPLDFVYIKPQHVAVINNLCEDYFWPGIDISECLQYPDFSCVVLYKKLVVGFALMVPDVKVGEAYISFIFTRPGWRRIGIAKFMIYHLIQTCMGKDITLHVSVTNPAIQLYQQFGFKVEEVVLDFYDTYLENSSRESKHAFFLRLER